jgi:hypothetical protein
MLVCNQHQQHPKIIKNSPIVLFTLFLENDEAVLVHDKLVVHALLRYS